MASVPPAVLLLVVLGCMQPGAHALTRQDQLDALVYARDALTKRSPNWKGALESWTCPTPTGNSDSTCDPCGRKVIGNWEHMFCRGDSTGYGESGDGVVDGYVTSFHITDVNLDGPIPVELCAAFPRLREFDVDGGHLTGPVPQWFDECFPNLEELDLSHNRLTGTIPVYLSKMPSLSEVKMEHNALLGTIPPEIGDIPKLRRFRVEGNRMHGSIPSTFSKPNATLTQLELARNDFEGDLSAVANSHLMQVTVHGNPRMCGMVPASVRWAKGYNPWGTNLGKPC